MSNLEKYDQFLTNDGPAALVIREQLMPVEGPDGVLFPATFAAGGGFSGGYNINIFGDEKEGKNACLIDSVGSQGNRIEPIFMQEEYRCLVPQIVVIAGDKRVNLLEVGHRAGDALLRCSTLYDDIQSAFREVLAGNAEPLAKLAPTSLVFGVWDSRDTQAKLPRLVSSTIRAFNVRKLTRGAVYVPPLDYTELDVFSEEDKAKAKGDSKSPPAKRGFVHNPASGSHGGVIAEGGVRRDATLGLAALRHLHADNEEKTLALRRYILGLSLVAFTTPIDSYLRQGCILVRDPNQTGEFVEVFPNGERKPCSIQHVECLEFATTAAEAFDVGKNRDVQFEKERAKKDVEPDESVKGKSKRGGKKAESSTTENEDN